MHARKGLGARHFGYLACLALLGVAFTSPACHASGHSCPFCARFRSLMNGENIRCSYPFCLQMYENNVLSYGVMGTVTSLPAGYTVENIVQVGAGVNAVMEDWGARLLQRYGKSRTANKQRDLTVRAPVVRAPALLVLARDSERTGNVLVFGCCHNIVRI